MCIITRLRQIRQSLRHVPHILAIGYSPACMNTSIVLTDLNDTKLLRLGNLLLSITLVDLKLALASLLDYVSPGNGVWLLPLIPLSAVGGILMAVFWLLRLIWLFVANNPEPVPVSGQQLKVTFSWLMILAAFEGLTYYIIH